MAFSTSAVAACCCSASLSSRVSRAVFVSRRRTAAGVLWRFNLAVLERRAFIGFLAAGARAANGHARRAAETP